MDALRGQAVAAARGVPDWVSAGIHCGGGGRRVVSHVQLEGHEAVGAITRHLPGLRPIQRNTRLGQVAPGQHEAVHAAERHGRDGWLG